MKAGVEPGDGPRPERAARRRLDRLAALAGGLPLGLRARRRRTRGCSRRRGGTDLCTAFVGGVPELPVYEGELQARALGAAIESWDPDGTPLIGEVGELVITRADAVDADLLLGRRRRLALPRGLLRHVPGRLAPRRLDRDHRPRHGDHHRPLRRDDQPRRHPHGHGRDLPRGAGRRRDHRRAGGRRAGRGRGRVDAAVRRAARGRGAERRRRGRDPPARARGLLAAPRPERGDRGRARSRARSRARCSSCRSSGS